MKSISSEANMRQAMLPRSLCLAVALSSLGYTSVSAAQSRLALEEIVVTATRRAASLQDVSVAVTAIPESMLQQAGAVSTEDIVALVPSLSMQKGANPRSSSFNVRGIGTQSYSTAVEPSISTVVDGVVMGRSGQSFMQLLDVERVEVLRGPQGTLFGKNASGGVVHIISKDPSEDSGGEVMMAASESGGYRSGATLTGGLADDLAGRLTVFGSHQDGWIYNEFDGSERNENDDWSVRGKLLWDLTDELSLKWSSDYYQKDCDCSQPTIRSVEPIPSLLTELSPVNPGEENTAVNNNGDLSLNVKSYGHALQLDWQLGEYELTSITAQRKWQELYNEDVDQRPISVVGYDQLASIDQDQFTQEFRLASPQDSMINYVVGAFYFKQSVNRTVDRSLLGGHQYGDFTVDTENYAVFGESTLSLNDSLRLIIGGRYTADDVSYVHTASVNIPAIGQMFGVNLADQTNAEDLSGKLALEWDLDSDSLVYLSYAQGYKGPGFSLNVSTQALTPAIEAETSDAFELGLKSNLWDGRLAFNAALFHTAFKGWQTESFVPADGGLGQFQTTNAGAVSTRGLELDVTAQLTENLRAFSGLTLVDAKIDDFKRGPCSFGQTYRGECPTGEQDLSGGVLPGSSDWKLNLMLSYKIPTESLPFDWTLAANITAQDDVQYSVTQDPNTVQGAYELLDLSLGLNDKADQYSTTLSIKNVLDKHYVQGIGSVSSLMLPNGYVQQVPVNHQRTVAIDLRYRW